MNSENQGKEIEGELETILENNNGSSEDVKKELGIESNKDDHKNAAVIYETAKDFDKVYMIKDEIDSGSMSCLFDHKFGTHYLAKGHNNPISFLQRHEETIAANDHQHRSLTKISTDGEAKIARSTKNKQFVSLPYSSSSSSTGRDEKMPPIQVEGVEDNIFLDRSNGNQIPTYIVSPASQNDPFSGDLTFTPLYSNHVVLEKKQCEKVAKFKCQECDKLFMAKSSLNKHVSSVHNGVKKFPCEQCGKSFTVKTSLERHVKDIHVGVKPFSCEECDKTFKQKAHLETHVQTHSGIKPFQCLECGKCFSNKSYLITHTRMHFGEKPYQCDECEKAFTNKSNLRYHKTIHTGKKPFLCIECGKCFTHNHHLQKHMATHTGAKPFECENCGKAFSQKSNLEAHRMIHSAVYPFKCQECGKGFKRKNHLEYHSKVHTGIKAYQCDVCGRPFSQKHHLKVHEKIHAAEVKVFNCNVCGKSFTKEENLDTHSKVHAWFSDTSAQVEPTKNDFFKRSSQI